MEKIIELITRLVNPGKTWGDFLQKIISVLLLTFLGVYAFNEYENKTNKSHWDDLPLHVAIKKDGRKEEVQIYLNRLLAADKDLISVWVYSWPDARTLIPAANAGGHNDPVPLGYFRRTDSTLVGELVMEFCDCLNRPSQKLLACPIMAENDAWGVVVFEHKVNTDRPKKYKATYIALAHKLSHIIYGYQPMVNTAGQISKH